MFGRKGWKLFVWTLPLVSPAQEEKLEGDNRYFCETCQSKQNATRRIRLLSLPGTLNLQLMRFVFDRQVVPTAAALGEDGRIPTAALAHRRERGRPLSPPPCPLPPAASREGKALLGPLTS